MFLQTFLHVSQLCISFFFNTSILWRLLYVAHGNVEQFSILNKDISFMIKICIHSYANEQSNASTPGGVSITSKMNKQKRKHKHIDCTSNVFGILFIKLYMLIYSNMRALQISLIGWL